MAYVSGGYAQRVLSTRPSNEYQEGPEEESWVDGYNLPFSTKRPGGQPFENQAYPVKRPRHTLEASHPCGRQEEIHPRINGNTIGHPSRHLPAPASLLHEQAQYGPNIPQLNRVQSMPYHQTSTQSNPMEYRSRQPSISHLANQAQGNFASSHHSVPPGNHRSPPGPSPYTEPGLRQPDGRTSFAQPFRPSQNISNQLFQPQNPPGSRHNFEFTTPRNQSVPPSPAPHQRPAQPAASGAGTLGYGYQPPSQGFQPPPQGFQPSPQGLQNPTQEFQAPTQGFQSSPGRRRPSSRGFQRSPRRLQPSPTQARPDTILQSDTQPRSETRFANQANIQKLSAVKRAGPFILDDDEDAIGFPKSLITNSETRSNIATASQIPVRQINFAQGRRGAHSLTFGLDDPLGRKKNTGSRDQKNKSVVKRSKKDADAVLEEAQKQAEAYAKIKEKQDMATKAKDTDALFEEPINEAAQARIQADLRKEETRKREVEARRRYKEEMETIKKDAAEREKARKEAEKAERASKKVKTQEERDAIQKTREEEDKKRHDEQKRNAEELIRRKRQEQSEREAAVTEKEAAAERKRQQDAGNLKKNLEASKLAATSLKSAKKGQGGREETGERATTATIGTPEPPVDDDGGGLFVPEQVGTEISDETLPRGRTAAVHPWGDIQRLPLTPISPPNNNSMSNVEQKASNIAAAIKEIPGYEDIALRALGGWRGARNANTETKVASIVIEHYIELLSAEQKKRDEAFAQDRARGAIKSQEDFEALFEKLSSSLTGKFERRMKETEDKVLNAPPPIMPTNARSGLNSARDITVSPKKYASETQYFLGRKPTKQPKELAPLGQKSLSDSEARRREKEEIRLAEKAKKRFEVKLHRDNADQGRYMSEYEFRSTIEEQVKDYRERREKKYEKEKMMMPHGGGNPQGQARFGYEDIDFNEDSSNRPSKSNSQSDKGRCGGVMARLRESNGSLGHFQGAAAAKIVNDRMHLGDDADSESEVSEEDPDDDESDTTLRAQPKPAESSDRRDSPSGTKAAEAKRMATFEYDSKPTQVIKPRYLQDKEMVYIFSVQRSEIRDGEKSLPITLKQFFDKEDANEFAEEELRRTRWGPSMFRPEITQRYSKTGLFNGRASIDSEDNVVECVDVVAQARYIGDLDDFDHEKVKAIIPPKVYWIFKSITKKVQPPMGSRDDEASENEEAEQNMEVGESEETEQNMEIYQNGETEQVTETDHNGEVGQATETDPNGEAEQAKDAGKNSEAQQIREAGQNGEAEQAMEADQKKEAEQGTDAGHNDNENPDDHARELGGDGIDALFEEEVEAELSEISGQNLAANVHQLSLDSKSPEEKPEMMLTQTCKPLESYTDIEVANKRASEIFLEEIRPVGGDIAQLVAFQNDAEKPVRESLESLNESGELFSASNNYANGGEIRIWVEDFEMKGPLN